MKSKTSIRESRGDRIFNVFNYIFLFVIFALAIYPLWFVVIASISDPDSVSMGKVLLLPKNVTFEYYKYVFEYREVMIGYRNTLFYTGVGTALNVLITMCTAYAITSPKLFGRRVITVLMMLTMFFSGGIVPTFLVMNKIGMVDKWYTLLFIGLVTFYNIMVARSYVANSIPRAMLEAAEIDGCGDIATLFRIVLPVAKPIMIVLALYYASSHWNNFMNGLIYINDRNKLPLQVFLREILVLGQTQSLMDTEDAQRLQELSDLARSIKYALIVVSSLPMILAYPFAQKYLIGGVMIGSVKG